VDPLFVPIFPLPDMTFFPHTLLPLHIFEGRYRAMVTDCLARDRRLAVVGLRPGHEDDYQGRPPVFDVFGVGRIVRCERLPTGRFNIVVRGEGRVRLVRELPADTLYRIAAARPLTETGADRPDVARLVVQVREQCLRLLGALGRSTAEVRDALAAIEGPGELADRVTSAVLPQAATRQALLEELDVERRLTSLSSCLGRLLTRLAEER
jgi:Lon protease-like protein